MGDCSSKGEKSSEWIKSLNLLKMPNSSTLKTKPSFRDSSMLIVRLAFKRKTSTSKQNHPRRSESLSLGEWSLLRRLLPCLKRVLRARRLSITEPASSEKLCLRELALPRYLFLPNILWLALLSLLSWLRNPPRSSSSRIQLARR